MTALSQNISHLLSSNADYASTYQNPHLVLPSKKNYALITCMDPRLEIEKALGVELGDAAIIRNAGGSAKAAIRDLAIAGLIGGTTEVVIVKHTDCGMTKLHGKDLTKVATMRIGQNAADHLHEVDVETFSDPAASAREDVAWAKKSPLLSKNVSITGWVFDMDSGKVEQVA